jgi:hypothetical protein
MWIITTVDALSSVQTGMLRNMSISLRHAGLHEEFYVAYSTKPTWHSNQTRMHGQRDPRWPAVIDDPSWKESDHDVMDNILRSTTIEKYAWFKRFFFYRFCYMLLLPMVQLREYWCNPHSDHACFVQTNGKKIPAESLWKILSTEHFSYQSSNKSISTVVESYYIPHQDISGALEVKSSLNARFIVNYQQSNDDTHLQKRKNHSFCAQSAHFLFTHMAEIDI